MLLLLCFCSCATYDLSKSVWYNLAFIEDKGQKVDLTTSLHFISDRQVEVYTSVVMDTTFVVTPFKYAEGTYNVTGNPKKEAKISVDITTIDNKNIKIDGAYHKYEAMLLMYPDSVVKAYGKLPNVKLP